MRMEWEAFYFFFFFSSSSYTFSLFFSQFLSQTWCEKDSWNSWFPDVTIFVFVGDPSTDDFHDVEHLLFFLNLTSRGRVTDRWLLQLAARRDEDDRPDPRLPLSWWTGIRSNEPLRKVLWPRLLNGESSLLLLPTEPSSSSSSSSSSSTSGSSGCKNMTLLWWFLTNRVDFRIPPGCCSCCCCSCCFSLKRLRPALDEATTSDMLRITLTCCSK